MSKKTNVVIFDFDGTLADTGPLIRTIYDDLAVRNSWPKLTDTIYSELRHGSLNQARKWVGIKFWQVPSIIKSGRKLMHLEAEKVVLFPGIIELIRQLKTNGFELYVLSRNSSELVQHVLDRYGLDQDMSVMSRALFRSKSIAINRLILDKRYARKRLYMVGDETRDIDAGTIAGVKTIAVTWGLQDESLLESLSPTHVAHKPSDISDILNKR